ncbi:glycosyltransferase [Halobacteriovorax sp. HLS]|uniref:glycosyltransferase n=1 Tax=Halobacteriovorax sp. HLS TaxID=2234000 RepID=UPI000FD769DD|nr:glycosyltransferase [Halobacteriovorax sp. HLS]
MEKRIIISAYNIHSGGGKVLLRELLSSLPKEYEFFIFLDDRLDISIQETEKIKTLRVKNSFLSRLFAERKLKKISKKFDSLFCFGNLPPLFKSKIKTTIYLQNKYLISPKFICRDSFQSVIRMSIEKIWFELRKSKDYLYLVQTSTMKVAFFKNQGNDFNVKTFPFLPKIIDRNTTADKDQGFLYIASDEKHKNHKNLIAAWKELANEGITPSLTLVINKGKLSDQIKEASSANKLNIKVIHDIKREDIFKLYTKSEALIYPSLMESFGLPLLEAKHFNLPIIASEMDYVRDVVKPIETFDPHSPISISRAIKRFMSINSEIEIPSTESIFDEL